MMKSLKKSIGFEIICIGFVLILLCCVHVGYCELEVGFYRNSCEFAESIVKDEVRKGFLQNTGMAAGLVRMHFHDCFVRGCDASVLIDSTPSNKAEKDAPPNNPSLRGFEIIDNAKARLEYVCKGVVSCADIVAFAARDGIELTGGIGYDVPAGRRDGRTSRIADTSNLPPPTFNVSQLTAMFRNHGFTQDEMVTLSGAHTIGRSHCSSFIDRLYNFSGTSRQDPSLNPTYASHLKQQCRQGATKNTDSVVPMDVSSSTVSDTSYYTDIMANRGLFTSDQTLVTSATTAARVYEYGRNPLLWKIKFAAAMVKMGGLGVLTGGAGEIRANCRVINPSNTKP